MEGSLCKSCEAALTMYRARRCNAQNRAVVVEGVERVKNLAISLREGDEVVGRELVVERIDVLR